jgi:O-acetyl-ADP-ribose deacetylase
LHDEAKLLRRSYWNSLKLAAALGLKSVAFPSISTGTYRYPTEEASGVAIKAIKDYLTNEGKIEKVIMVLFSEKDYGIYSRAAKEVLG